MGALPDELMAQGDVLIEEQLLSKSQLREYWGRRMAMLPQEPSRSLNPTMTLLDQVWESLCFVAKKSIAPANNWQKKNRAFRIDSICGLLPT